MLKRAEIFRLAILAVLACLMSCYSTPAQADVLPPGGKFVDHQLRFENLTDYPDHVFYLGWHVHFRKPEGEWKVRRLSEAGEISTHPPETPPYGAKMSLAAVPKSQTKDAPTHGDASWFEGKTPGVKLAEVDVDMIRTGPVTDRRSTFWTVYRVALGDSLTLERTRHDVPTAAPQLPFAVLTACAIAALSAITLMIIVGYRFAQEFKSGASFRR